MRLSLDEIHSWKDFEDLIADYFRLIKNADENSLIEVRVDPSGEGTDGGRDVFLIFRINDSISIYERRWVVQCKFYTKSLSTRDINSVNIPTLIHQYGAEGYLLVCKNSVSSKVSEMFEDLRKNCCFNYSYEIWDGNILLSKLLVKPELIKKFFPKYQDYLEEKKNRKLNQ